MLASSYSDIALVPQKCTVDSRKSCDTSVDLGGRSFDLPVIAANMKSVIDEETCVFLAQRNLFYIMHRFGPNHLDFCKSMYDKALYSSISVGVDEDSYAVLAGLAHSDYGPQYITIDVANAWSEKTRKMIVFIKEFFPKTFLIVGNVATGAACIELESWGADCIKAGISGGSVCLTRNKTGFFVPMVTCIQDCVNSGIRIPLIADGGIKEHCDVAKAISLGAKMVMAGSLFAGFDQSAGNVIEIEDKSYKEYFGSASKYNKEEQKNIEGKKILIPYRGDMSKFLKELKEDLQSSISYSGGSKLADLVGCPYIEV